MDDAGRAVVDVWTRLVALAERIGPADWRRTTPLPDADVSGLVTHLAGVHHNPQHQHQLRHEHGHRHRLAPATDRASARALEGLRAAQAAQTARVAALTSADQGRGVAAEGGRVERVLRASCLDLWVHNYDLAAALGEPVDLDDCSPVVAEASTYLLRFAPYLFAGSNRGVSGGERASLRIALHGAVDHDRTVAIRDGRGAWAPDDGGGNTISGKPTALLLLLSGRGDPEHWRDAGALDWSGPHAEAFVRHARLLGQAT